MSVGVPNCSHPRGHAGRALLRYSNWMLSKTRHQFELERSGLEIDTRRAAAYLSRSNTRKRRRSADAMNRPPSAPASSVASNGTSGTRTRESLVVWTNSRPLLLTKTDLPGESVRTSTISILSGPSDGTFASSRAVAAAVGAFGSTDKAPGPADEPADPADEIVADPADEAAGPADEAAGPNVPLTDPAGPRSSARASSKQANRARLASIDRQARSAVNVAASLCDRAEFGASVATKRPIATAQCHATTPCRRTYLTSLPPRSHFGTEPRTLRSSRPENPVRPELRPSSRPGRS